MLVDSQSLEEDSWNEFSYYSVYFLQRSFFQVSETIVSSTINVAVSPKEEQTISMTNSLSPIQSVFMIVL